MVRLSDSKNLWMQAVLATVSDSPEMDNQIKGTMLLIHDMSGEISK